MSTKTIAPSDELELVLQRAIDVLKGSGRSSFLALAATIALKRSGFVVEQVLHARRQGGTECSSDAEVALAFNILSKQFSEFGDDKFVQLLHVLELPERTFCSDKDWGIAYDLCLEKYKPVLGKKEILLQLPELAQLVASVYTIEQNATVYSPFSGACCFVQYLPESVSLNIQELQDEAWAIASLRLTAYGLGKSAQLSKCDPVKQWNGSKFDFIFSFPPFEDSSTSQNNTLYSATDAIIEQCLTPALNGSKVAIVVPYWFLIAADNEELRKQLVEYDVIESVTYFSSTIFHNRTYPVALLCLNKQKTNKNQILFFDAQNVVIEASPRIPTIDVGKVLDVLHGKSEVAEARYIGTGMVKMRNYSLHPIWHLLDFKHGIKETDHLVSLGTIATIIRSRGSNHEANEADYVFIRDLSGKTEDFKLKHQLFKPDAAREYYITVLKEPCLLVALAWHEPKPTWYTPNRGKPICIGDKICALQVDSSKVDIAYLVSELRSDFFTHQFSVRKGGVQTLYDDDFLGLEIRLPALEEQLKIASLLTYD